MKINKINLVYLLLFILVISQSCEEPKYEGDISIKQRINNRKLNFTLDRYESVLPDDDIDTEILEVVTRNYVTNNDIDLEELGKVPPAIDQRDFDNKACTSHTLSYGLKSFHEAIEKNISFKDSNVKSNLKDYTYHPLFLHQITKKYYSNLIGNTGISIKMGMQLLSTYGTISFTKNSDFIKSLNKDEIEKLKPETSTNRIKIFAQIPVESKYTIKTIEKLLEEQIPVAIKVPFNKRYHNYCLKNAVDTIWNNEFQKKDDNFEHAILIIGYNNNPDKDDTKYFRFLNSYGSSWCGDGYGKISYEVFKKIRKNTEAFIAVDYVNSEINAQIDAFLNGGYLEDFRDYSRVIDIKFDTRKTNYNPRNLMSPVERLRSPNLTIEIDDLLKRHIFDIKQKFPITANINLFSGSDGRSEFKNILLSLGEDGSISLKGKFMSLNPLESNNIFYSIIDETNTVIESEKLDIDYDKYVTCVKCQNHTDTKYSYHTINHRQKVQDIINLSKAHKIILSSNKESRTHFDKKSYINSIVQKFDVSEDYYRKLLKEMHKVN